MQALFFGPLCFRFGSGNGEKDGINDWTQNQRNETEALYTKKCTISAYETDKIDIKSSILKELAAVLHCSASYLLEGNKETEVDARLMTVLKEIEKSGLTEIALMQLRALNMIK